jgi:hypothetical protein
MRRKGTQRVGMTGHKGFFYHFLDMKTGQRAYPQRGVHRRHGAADRRHAPCSGLLRYRPSRRGGDPRLVDQIYWRVDWKWAQVRGEFVSMGWKPESGFIPHDWQGYNEAMLVVLLALGSPTHPVGAGRLERLDRTATRAPGAASWATST